MAEIDKPHDKFFRAVFGQEDNARDLLRNVLPEEILDVLDLRHIQIEDTTLIDEELRETQSDLLLRTSLQGSLAFIYLLIEHKSYPDRWTVFQLLRYMVRIWQRERSRLKKEQALPLIVPVLFYHGTREWSFPLDFSSYFSLKDRLDTLVSNIPDFRPVMVDLRKMENRELRGSLLVQVALKTLKYSLGDLRPYLVEILRAAMDLPIGERRMAFLTRLLEYIISGSKEIGERDVRQAIRLLGSREVREVYMTLAEQLIEKGKRKGRLEGRLEEKQETLIQMLVQKFGAVADEQKKRILETRDPEKLDQARALILEADNIAEVLRPLA